MLPYFRALFRYSKMKKLSILGIIVMLFLAACNPNKEKAFITPTHVAKVRQLDSLYSHHVQQQQTDSLKTILLSDAILLTESEEETKGINAITEWYTNAFAYGMKTIDFTATDISGDDNHFIEIGKAKVGLMIGDTDTLSYQTYKYIHVWYKQQNGSYKISREMWNN